MLLSLTDINAASGSVGSTGSSPRQGITPVSTISAAPTTNLRITKLVRDSCTRMDEMLCACGREAKKRRGSNRPSRRSYATAAEGYS